MNSTFVSKNYGIDTVISNLDGGCVLAMDKVYKLGNINDKLDGTDTTLLYENFFDQSEVGDLAK